MTSENVENNRLAMNPGKLLFFAGLAIAVVGALLWLSGSVKWFKLFHLPGDIAVEREGFSFYFPITSMLLISLLATAIFWAVGLLRK
jgi:hypothetical protein